MLNTKSKSLTEIVTCLKCKMFLLQPVFLPCQNNICRSHVDEASKMNQDLEVYKCEICHNDHEIPPTGFLLNKSLVETMDLNLHLNEKTTRAKEIITDFDILVRESRAICNDPDNFIYEYVHEAINKLDIEREELILQINDISDEMLTKLKSLEIECKSKLKSSIYLNFFLIFLNLKKMFLFYFFQS
jgi:hypothetical protein